jgi:hypothetical protein
VDSLHMLREMTKLRSVRAFIYIYMDINIDIFLLRGRRHGVSRRRCRVKN